MMNLPIQGTVIHCSCKLTTARRRLPVVVGDYECVLDVTRRSVGELVALLEKVEDLGVGGRAVLVGSAAAEAGQHGADLGVAALYEEVDHKLNPPAGEG